MLGSGEARIPVRRKNRIDSAGRPGVGGDGSRRDKVREMGFGGRKCGERWLELGKF